MVNKNDVVPKLSKQEYIAQFREKVELGSETKKRLIKLKPMYGIPTFRCFNKVVIFHDGGYYQH